MLSTDDVAKVYDTILSIPGMNETVKIDLKITRKNALLLNRVIERGLSVNEAENGSGLLDKVSAETLEELILLASECLKKAGLTDLSEKLKLLDAKWEVLSPGSYFLGSYEQWGIIDFKLLRNQSENKKPAHWTISENKTHIGVVQSS